MVCENTDHGEGKGISLFWAASLFFLPDLLSNSVSAV